MVAVAETYSGCYLYSAAVATVAVLVSAIYCHCYLSFAAAAAVATRARSEAATKGNAGGVNSSP